MFNNKIINDTYNYLLSNHSLEESNFIILNSLAILGDKKVTVPPLSEKENLKTLSINNIKRINNYKYPERLESFVKLSSKKSNDWQVYSFAKLALS